MTVLTRILLDKEEALRLKLFDPYRWHQLLWQAFPALPAPREFLFRVDDRGREYQIYLLSPALPTPTEWGHWESKPIQPAFLSHPRYRFQLRANPVIRKRLPESERGSGRSGPLVAINDEEELRGWLTRQGKRNGFTVTTESLLISPPAVLGFRKKGMSGTLSQVDFSGVMTVIDADRFAAAFTAGIGRAKSFGFGLLLLSPCQL